MLLLYINGRACKMLFSKRKGIARSVVPELKDLRALCTAWGTTTMGQQ